MISLRSWLRENAKKMAKSDEPPIPKFEAPPVVETVLGIGFERLDKWGIPHFGVFWDQVREQFPNFEVKHPVISHIEQFDRPQVSAESQIQLSSAPPDLRCWFIDEDDCELIQVQNNRFSYNWRKTAGKDAYPHYDESIRQTFQNMWTQFVDFVKQQQLGDVNVVQCEVTYVNHLEVGKGWNAISEIGNVLPCWAGKSNGEFLPSPENVVFDVSYRMPDNKGRLHISVRPAFRNDDGIEIIQLNLTARGKPEGSEMDSIFSWLDLGREWVVRGFTDFTAERMHSEWQRSV